ncbi:MAG TPA: Mur ligase family protein [Acidimicrobiia bacterium]|nr:Mur ligase family protein [Acidimicrobiia bacterium]
MTFDVAGYLDAHVNLESGIGVPAGRERGAPTLERITMLLRYLGSPEVEYPAIQITGTNGKTTTAHMCAALLHAAGLRVGATTSPHLVRVNERMTIDNEPIDDETLAETLRTVALVEREMHVNASYFEVLVAAALRWFDDEAVDAAVAEVGLGGTWDATNVVDGRVAVITNVSIDHVEYLGPTREEIATEKSGIIKPGATLVLGETDPDLADIFERRGATRVLRRDADFGARTSRLAVGGRVMDLYTPLAAYPDVYVPLHGAHQVDNAATALCAAEAFVGARLDDDIVHEAFANVRSPGRLEVVRRQPLVLLDGAHNVAGAHALHAALTEEFIDDARTLVVGMLREKEPHEMLGALGLEHVGYLVVCPPPSPRALAPEIVAKAAVDLGFDEARIDVVESVKEAVGAALLVTPEHGQVVITGSLYTVGAARALFVHER